MASVADVCRTCFCAAMISGSLLSFNPALSGWFGRISRCISKMAKTDRVVSEYFRQQKYKKVVKQEQEASWKIRHLHGMHLRQIEEVADIEKSHQWERDKKRETAEKRKRYFCFCFDLYWSRS